MFYLDPDERLPFDAVRNAELPLRAVDADDGRGEPRPVYRHEVQGKTQGFDLHRLAAQRTRGHGDFPQCPARANPAHRRPCPSQGMKWRGFSPRKPLT